jgi:hypothetical protein
MSKSFKSLLLLILSVFWVFLSQTKITLAKSNKNINFIVTAYYSPLPNQKKYITWTYSWDKRLNWEGHTTASWKPIKVWTLAAPSKYPFWTKIYFEWYGVWVVEDRWWAIVKAWVRWHEHDRIDIWMWYGDEWLQRALKWWKKTIAWRVVSKNEKVNLKFTKNVLEGLEKIKVNPEYHPKNNVKKLQENFKKLWIYNWKIDGNYNSIKKDIINFQIKNWIIKSKNDEAAWWFGPKTYIALLRRFWPKDVLIKQKNLIIKETNEKIEIILEAPEIRLNWDNPQKEEVIKVQRLFKDLWIYNWEIDWDYKKIKPLILKIQKWAKIIKKDNDWWAGYFWEKTKAALIKYCEEKYKKKITIDDINYNTLKIIAKKLKKLKSKNKIIKKLEKYLKFIKINSRKEKIKFLIQELKKR